MKASIEKKETRLKCKPCKKFYPDDGTVYNCECGRLLKRITVWNVKPNDVVVETGVSKPGEVLK